MQKDKKTLPKDFTQRQLIAELKAEIEADLAKEVSSIVAVDETSDVANEDDVPDINERIAVALAEKEDKSKLGIAHVDFGQGGCKMPRMQRQASVAITKEEREQLTVKIPELGDKGCVNDEYIMLLDDLKGLLEEETVNDKTNLKATARLLTACQQHSQKGWKLENIKFDSFHAYIMAVCVDKSERNKASSQSKKDRSETLINAMNYWQKKLDDLDSKEGEIEGENARTRYKKALEELLRQRMVVEEANWKETLAEQADKRIEKIKGEQTADAVAEEGIAEAKVLLDLVDKAAEGEEKNNAIKAALGAMQADRKFWMTA